MSEVPLLTKSNKLRAPALLNMLYKPSELAEELDMKKRHIYARLIPAGMPFREDESGRFWMHGPEVACWIREMSVRLPVLAEDEGFCVRCQLAVPQTDCTYVRCGRFTHRQSICPECGAKVNRGVKTR